jgi:prolyl 4-hydroxylase
LWQNEHRLAQADVTKYITNPLNAFILIKRTSAELELLRDFIPADLKSEFEELWEYKDDIIGAIEGLFRLQVTYRISSRDFADGIIMGKQVREPLSAHDLFVIGYQALHLKVEWVYPRNEDYFAIEYLQMSLDKVLKGDDPYGEVDRDFLVSTLAEVYKKVGNYQKCLMTLKFILHRDEIVNDLRRECSSFYDVYGQSKLYIEDPYDEEIHPIGTFNWKTDETYTNQACRGDRTLSIAEQSKLRCRYFSHSPFSKLARFRMEELYKEPLVYLFHDVMSDFEVEVIKNVSSVKLERGKNYLKGTKEGYTNRRITKTAFAQDDEHEVLKRLGRRVSVSQNEMFEVCL